MTSYQPPVTTKSLFYLFFLFIAFTLAACSGGGGGGSTPPSTDASLSALTISAGTLTPAFQSNTTSYSTTVANAVTSVTVNATVTDSNATLTVNGVATASGANSAAIALNVGVNAITVLVTAQDGSTTQTYTINVTRQNPLGTDASLSALTISAGSLSPVFQSNTTSYSTTVANAVTSVTINATTTDSNATLTVNGVATASGANSAAITLNVGVNTITVLVTAQDGTTTQTYTINVMRQNPPSTDASLSALTISAGTLSPVFQSNTTSYSATVANAVTSVTVNATVTDSNASFTVNGVATASGANSAAIALNVGANAITVLVTAQDGTTTQTYTINVTRQASTDASLSALTISAGTLTPAFQSNTTSYSTTVANAVTSVTVNATTTHSNATLTVNGVSTASGANSAAINLNQGSNTISIVVTAEDGVTTQTYTITVTRLPAATLSALTLTNATLDQTFQSSLTTYTSGVNFLVNAVRVNATLTDASATMTVNTVATSSGVDTAWINLAEGSNTITIVVTATDSVTTETYSIDITRLTAASLVEQSFSATGAASADNVGVSIAIDGDTMVIGAEGKDLAGPIAEAGAAYVFTRSSGVWTQQAELTAEGDAVASDNFGRSVAIDGDTIVVGTPFDDGIAFNAGAAYVFTRSGTTWSRQARLTASDAAAIDQFGISVAISGDTIVVGADTLADTGSAYVFTRSGTTWGDEKILTASNAEAGDFFGRSVAIEGDTIVVGAPGEDGDASSVVGSYNENATDAGAAYVFTRSGANWTQTRYAKASDAQNSNNFGDTVAISGNSIAIGATGRSSTAGAVYVFVYDGMSWTQQGDALTASNAAANDNFGMSISLSGERLVVGADAEDGNASSTAASPNDSAPNAGAVYVFMRNGTTWTQTRYIKASDAAGSDFFGASVGIDVDTLVVGAKGKAGTGALYVFQ